MSAMEEAQGMLERKKSSQAEDILVIVSLVASMLLIAVSTSMIAPFYPKEADNRGVSSSQYGFVFGALELASFVFGLPAGKLSGRISPRCMFTSGLWIQIFALLLFSSLHLVTEVNTFLSLSCLSRVLSGLGKAIINVSMFSYGPLMRPDQAASLTSLGEAMYGVGLMAGPPLGGLLYDFQGFYFPFLFIALLHLPLILISGCYMQRKHFPKKEETNIHILYLIDVWICLFCCAMVSVGTAMYLLSAEPKMRFLNVSATIVGLVFSVGPMTYIPFTVIIGKICDKGVSPTYFMFLGCLVSAGGFGLLGYSTILYLIALSCFLISLGMSGAFVPSLLYMTTVCLQAGFEDDITTRGTVSGMFVAASSLGAALGYAFGGILFETIGITFAFYILSGSFVLTALGVLIPMIKAVRDNF